MLPNNKIKDHKMSHVQRICTTVIISNPEEDRIIEYCTPGASPDSDKEPLRRHVRSILEQNCSSNVAQNEPEQKGDTTSHAPKKPTHKRSLTKISLPNVSPATQNPFPGDASQANQEPNVQIQEPSEIPQKARIRHCTIL